MEGICGVEGELKLYFDALDKVRTVVDKLETNVEIPQIAVIGNQSVGKSSVLELISGVRLPQGNDIVTRCPIMLQIRRSQKCSIELNGEHLLKSQMADKLNAAQDRVIAQYCSRARNEVTAKPVVLNISGPDVRDLTLVDLPGIQYSEDGLKNSIVSMIEAYIRSEATIILLINNCTSDPTATEALALARKHDPNQERTVCILTKPDEIKDDDIEKKEALMKLIQGQHAQLNFICGTFMVKGRQSNHGELSIEQVRDMEAEYFQKQSVFDTCWNMGSAGSIALTKAIESLALARMKKAFPPIRNEIIRTLKKKKDELHTFPVEMLPVGMGKKCRIITHIINDINSEYKLSIENELGKRVKLLFEMMQVKVLNLLRNESKKDEIIQDIMNCGGLNPHGFASVEKFKILFQMNLKRITAVTENTIYEVQDEAELLIEHIAMQKGKKLKLEQEFLTITGDVFRSNVRNLMKLYNDLIDSEMLPYLPDFMEFYFEGEKQLAKIPKGFTLHGNVPGFNEIPESLITTDIEESSRNVSTWNKSLTEFEAQERMAIEPAPKREQPREQSREQPDEEVEQTKKHEDEKRKKSSKKSKKEKDIKDGIVVKYTTDEAVPTTTNTKIENVKQLHISDAAKGSNENELIREAKAKKLLEGKLVYDAYRTYLYHTSVTLLMTVPKIICFHLFIKFPEDLQKTMLSKQTEFAENMCENTEAKIRYDTLVEDAAKLEETVAQFKNLLTTGI